MQRGLGLGAMFLRMATILGLEAPQPQMSQCRQRGGWGTRVETAIQEGQGPVYPVLGNTRAHCQQGLSLQ